MNELDKYYAELERKAEEKSKDYEYKFGGGYELSKGDYEGACLARAEYESGCFS